MSLLQRACKLLGGLALVAAVPCMVYGQTTTTYYTASGTEYAPAGSLLGEQTHPALALNASGGFLVWQDNITDGYGLGVSAVQLGKNFSPVHTNFFVNQNGVGDQENPRVALLQNGGAVFVWQGGQQGFQHIYARFGTNNGNGLIWATGDVMVNSDTNHYQVNPAVTVLTNGNVVVVWGSYGQANADGMQDVYGQILSPAGKKIGGEFLVNTQFTSNNQRNPVVAAFPNGNFLVAWVSEMERATPTSGPSTQDVAVTNIIGNMSVDIYARQFTNSSGTTVAAVGGEFLVNTSNKACANPVIGTASDGSYFIAWSEKDTDNINNSWDVIGRPFTSSGVGGASEYINTQLYGDQYAPQISAVGLDYLVVWTSLAQDGSREGIFGQFVHNDGAHVGGEFRVNTTVLNSQIYPTIASDGVAQFLVTWSSYVGGLNSMDLNAQRYAPNSQPLLPPNAPSVIGLDSWSLSVTWPTILGFNIGYYELFIDGSSTPVNVTNNMWSYQDYNPSTTHTFQLAYVLTTGQVSPLSAVSSGTTWGVDKNHDGLPDDWETLYYGSNQASWPGYNTVLAPGVTALDVFNQGANPKDPSTWLREWISQTPEGYFLNWTTVPGGIYQVQSSTDLKNWTLLGSPHFAAGTSDSLYLGLSGGGYYRVYRNRYIE